MSRLMADDPPLPEMLTAILHAARDKFPDNDWNAVEGHIRKAWNALAHDAPWDEISGPARRVWEASRRP